MNILESFRRKQMLQKFFKTDSDLGSLILRVVAGVVMFPHGAQKLLGWFGGFGFTGTMGYFVGLGIPSPIAFLIIIGESLGALGLIFGFLTRLSAFGIGIIMVAAAIIHAPYGFFMNWFANQQGEGYEFHLLYIAISVVLIIKGAGKASVDSLIAEKLK
ncbi:DoxX family protein [Leptospira santarosai str. ST188]|uniref:DoxX family protein n=4 Tax=Leptospira santarosai TaxID=28183 RepID=A0A0E2BRI6_9LEPT|nr:DoxX family protein [Leptospira santarosai str. MOR084]EKO78955.1 DoxX family protein [Leptospira sp. Fiocruz LV3954]EKR92444.1 DoxX family protein [Leptospira santarosai str. CBC379]EMF90758.1 DoxX family protein [Leptospira santarosai str. ST188]EMI68259.1 DoxX family protein [Leptospira sp. Fiocruz LV4135]EMM85698.1 DoxX family protein [Leptospira santarosai str. 2000027870]EMN19912.1 DoxX family protein [Leptospira santarosai serovar Arenal str. MAVJ 401]EMO15980.1 DoxX family protein